MAASISQDSITGELRVEITLSKAAMMEIETVDYSAMKVPEILRLLAETWEAETKKMTEEAPSPEAPHQD